MLLDVFGELRAKRPCSLYRWASVRCILMEGEEERLLAAEPHERILQDARVAIPAMESGRTSEAVAHDIVVAARGSLSLASVLSLMERLRFITSLIGCLQASARRRQARKARFNSQVIPSGGSSAIASLISLMLQPGHTCPDVCERRPGGGLWSLWEPLAEEGEEGATMQSRRHPGLAGRRPLHFFRKCWRVAVSAYAGAAICFFGLILRSGFRAWERRSGHLQN